MTTIGPTTLSAPLWSGDYGNREHILPGGARVDPTQFRSPDAVAVVVGAAGAAAAAVSVPVDALSGPIPDGTVIHLGTNKFITLNAAAAAGATSLTTLAIPTALVDNDVGYYAGVLPRSIPSGTVLGRTIAERDALTAFGPAAAGDALGETFLLYHDITDAVLNPDATLYRPGSVVKENFLPVLLTALNATVMANVRARYDCTIGV